MIEGNPLEPDFNYIGNKIADVYVKIGKLRGRYKDINSKSRALDVLSDIETYLTEATEEILYVEEYYTRLKKRNRSKNRLAPSISHKGHYLGDVLCNPVVRQIIDDMDGIF